MTASGTWASWQQDLATAVARSAPLFEEQPEIPAAVLRDRLLAALGTSPAPESAAVTVDGTWTRDGLDGTDLSWDCGFGPRTRAWLLRPAGETGTLPGVLALFEHGGVKVVGREKLTDGPGQLDADLAATVRSSRNACYGGRAWAEDLARRGVAVLIHDVFGFGSRRLPEDDGAPPRLTEAQAAKAAGVLGTSWASLIAGEDRLALSALRSLPAVDGARLAAVGMSGGGARAGLLRVLEPGLAATVVVTMMSTLGAMVPKHFENHAWTWLSPRLGAAGDWPSVVGSWTERPLLVQYGLEDHLFPPSGMVGADAQLRRRFAAQGHPENYTGSLLPVGHVFTPEMQDAAWKWLADVLGF
ncbi:dienelactone hydrolase family protein [Sinomonas terrae]|uniref:Acetylesterase n=1 Tax=Sinomonas terrae TaxID=2908838 RepID=A0ABS9TXF4_9MICC|nr:acetylesterase [Sinomonas terrae]MCH6469093.1 acetylesterase [Sinomonas terrae]